MTVERYIVNINGREVSISGDQVDVVIKSRQFQEWVAGLDSRFDVRSIESQSVDLKGGTARYIKYVGTLVDHGKSIDRISFMRGGSVASLLVFTCKGEKWTILVRQPRFSVGIFDFPEIPAGTLEGDDTFVSGIIREIEEEVGRRIKPEDTIDLIDLIYGNKFKGMYPSVGACDEFIRLFACECGEIEEEELMLFNGKKTGLAHENEHIILQVARLNDLPFITSDSKTLCALLLYNTAKAMGKI